MKKKKNKDAKVGIIGMGTMGRGLLYQCVITPGIDCVAVCDHSIDKCINVLQGLGVDYQVVNGSTKMEDVINKGRVAIVAEGSQIIKCGLIDTVIDATSSIIEGGKFALKTLEHGKNLMLMNSSVDLQFGPYLMEQAKANGVLYSSCDGDQYGVLKHLIDESKAWGFELVMVGNVKGYLDRYANPTSVIAEADKRGLNHKVCSSFTDGTKLNIEMSIIANAYGLRTAIPGMYGPRAADVTEVFEQFDLNQLWSSKVPVVDYLLGAVPGGAVYVVGYCENSYQRKMMEYYKMGEGPFYLFYRPYHLCHVEAINGVLDTLRGGKGYLLQPEYGFTTNVYAYAKRNLKQGETLDGVGGYTCYGLIENTEDTEAQRGLPICLADGIIVRRDISKDEKIYLSDVSYDPTRLDFELYRRACEASKRIQFLK